MSTVSFRWQKFSSAILFVNNRFSFFALLLQQFFDNIDFFVNNNQRQNFEQKSSQCWKRWNENFLSFLSQLLNFTQIDFSIFRITSLTKSVCICREKQIFARTRFSLINSFIFDWQFLSFSVCQILISCFVFLQSINCNSSWRFFRKLLSY